MTDEKATARHPRKVAQLAAASSAVEWYEYFTFGNAAALVFGSIFFGPLGATGGVLASFAVFAVGFGARPLGGILGGHLGDRHGRKPLLVWSLAVMAVATVGIGLLPTYATVGVAAPVMLIALRIIQGLAVGAQYGASALLSTEHAPKGRAGIYGSAVTLGVPIGLILANVVFFVITSMVSDQAFLTWAWRIPFLLGVFGIVLAWRVHVAVDETPEFKDLQRSGHTSSTSPLRNLLQRHLGTVMLASFSYMAASAVYYITVTGILTYSKQSLNISTNVILAIVILNAVLQLAILPFAASLSDRFGRIRIYAIGSGAILVWAIPMFLLIDTGSTLLVFFGIFGMGVAGSIIAGPHATLLKELFPPEVRYTGVSLSYQLANIFGGAIAPFMMVLLLDRFDTTMAVSGYVIVLAVISLLCTTALGRRRYATNDPADRGSTATRARVES